MGLHLFKLFFQQFLNNKTLRIVWQLINILYNYSSQCFVYPLVNAHVAVPIWSRDRDEIDHLM